MKNLGADIKSNKECARLYVNDPIPTESEMSRILIRITELEAKDHKDPEVYIELMKVYQKVCLLLSNIRIR